MITYRFNLDAKKPGCQKTLQGFTTSTEQLARRLAVSIMANGEKIDLDESTTAVMYVTPFGASSPSVNDCEIEENTIYYNILPNDISREGMTKMQVKLIRSNPDSATSATMVFASPIFQLEVLPGTINDGSAVTSPTFTALEQAIARANAVYNHMLERIDFTEDLVFHAYYADGSEYENDSFQIVSNTANELVEKIAKEKENMESGLAAREIEALKAESIAEQTALRDEARTLFNFTKSYAVGTNGEVRDDDAIDNAKYYYDQIKDVVNNGALPLTGGTLSGELNIEYTSPLGTQVNVKNEDRSVSLRVDSKGNRGLFESINGLYGWFIFRDEHNNTIITFPNRNGSSPCAYLELDGSALTDYKKHKLQNKEGTIALLSDVPDIYMNGEKLSVQNGIVNIDNVVTDVQPITGSSAWNSNTSYKVGNYCIAPNNRLYKCIVANTNIQPPNTAYWQTVTLYNLSVAEDNLETKVDSMFITIEYSVDFTYEAGTIGTRGAQVSTDIQVSGYVPVGVHVVYVSSSNNYNPNCFFSSTKQLVFTNAYRASASAVSNGSIRFEVLYMKK